MEKYKKYHRIYIVYYFKEV